MRGLDETAPVPAVVVLISGNGSNLQALIDAQASAEGLGGRLVLVVSDQPQAYGLERARQAGIPTAVLPARDYPDRAAYDQALMRLLEPYQPDLLVLAGFMRILSSAFVLRYAGRLLNIHPSLLPKYKGLHTHRRALEAGDALHGLSIHFVTEALDSGPVVLQVQVPVEPGDDEHRLAHRVHIQEHAFYPRVVRWFLQGRLQLRGDQPTLDGQPLPPKGLLYAPGSNPEDKDHAATECPHQL